METFKGHWACPNRCHLLSELRRRHRNSILHRFLLKTCMVYFYLLLLPFWFFGLCLLLLLVSLGIDPVLFVLDLHMKYTVEVVLLCMYFFLVCYREIVAPYVRSVGHVFAYLYTLDDDLERPMEYETSLLRKGFPLQKYISAPSPL